MRSDRIQLKPINRKIRAAMLSKGITYQQVADCMGISGQDFDKLLNSELTADQEEQLRTALQELGVDVEHFHIIYTERGMMLWA